MSNKDAHADLLVRAREELHASEERFRHLIESIQDYAIFMLDPTGQVLTWNSGAERIKGYKAEEIVGQHFSRFYRPEDAALCPRLLAHAERHGRVEAEAWRVRKDGSLFWANVIITCVRDTAGTVVGYAKVTRDLTERRRAEEERLHLAQAQEANRVKDEYLQREQRARQAAEEARSSLATTLRSIGDAVMATDDHGIVTLMNPVAEKLTGWQVSDALGRPLRDVFKIINQHTRSVVESPVDRVLREGVVVGLANHTVLIARDGNELPILDSGAPIRDESGAIRGVVLVFRDASEELKTAVRRDLLADLTSVLASSLDYRETLSRVARLAVPPLGDLFRIDIVESGAQPVQIAVAHADPAKLEAARDLWARQRLDPSAPGGVANVLRAGVTEHYPDLGDEALGAAREDQPLRALRDLGLHCCVIAPLLAGQRVVGILTVGFAGSGRRYGPDDVSFIEEIGRRAAAAIENARRYAAEQQARDMADAASRAKDEFLALVSHELRTPLSSILGWSKMLLRPAQDDSRRAQAVESIERNAVAMTQLVEDLLDVSRIVGGKLRLHLGRVELAAVIDAALETIKPAAAAKSIQVEMAVGPGVRPIQGDASRLQQVVWNLLSNAVKFTAPGGRVKITLRPRELEQEIVVSDTGRGIDPRLLPRVFEPFQQGDAIMTRASGGLGLGLSLVKHIVELHGGQVEAASEGAGRGATFTVLLPTPPTRPVSGTHRAVSAPRPASSAATPQLTGLRVLIVDDEPDMRELLSEVLVDAGCQVSTAGSVAEAMRHFAGDKVPEVLLSDIGMPGENGYDLIRRVRALPPDQGGQIPAAALTAYARASDRQKALAAGFAMHVTKPVEPDELVRLIGTLTDR